MESYETIGILGEGTYGVVLKAIHHTTGKLVAIKKFKQTDADDYVHKTSLREVRILKQLHHPNVVSLYDVFRRNDKLYLVFELVENTILQLLERTRTGMDRQDVRRYAYQILRGIDYCHTHNVIHRDVKPENILVSRDGFLKICDFGFARHLTVGGKYTDYVATRWYRAPELLVGDVYYDRSVDVWAIGCIIAELTSSLPLFPGESDLDQLYLILKTCGPLPERMVRTFERNPLFRAVSFPHTEVHLTLQQRFPKQSPEWLEFLSACLRLDPEDRPSCAELMNLAYFQKNNFKADYEAELQRTTVSLYKSTGTDTIMAPLSSKTLAISNSVRNPLNPLYTNHDRPVDNVHEKKPHTQWGKASNRELSDSNFMTLPLTSKHKTDQPETNEKDRLPSIIENLSCGPFPSLPQRECQGVVKDGPIEVDGELMPHDRSKDQSPPTLPTDPKLIPSNITPTNAPGACIAARIPSLDVLWSKYLFSTMQPSSSPDPASKMPPILTNITNLTTAPPPGAGVAPRPFITAVMDDGDGPLQLVPSPHAKPHSLGEGNGIRTSSPREPDGGDKHPIERKRIPAKPYPMGLSEVPLGGTTCNTTGSTIILPLSNMSFGKGEGFTGNQGFSHAAKANQTGTKHFSNNTGRILNMNLSTSTYLVPLTGRDDCRNLDRLSTREFDDKATKRSINELKDLSSIGDNTLYTLNGTTTDSKASRIKKSSCKLCTEKQQRMQRLPIGGVYFWGERLGKTQDSSVTNKGTGPVKSVSRKPKIKNVLRGPSNEEVPHLWSQPKSFWPPSPKFDIKLKAPEKIVSDCSPYRDTSITNLHKNLSNSTKNLGNCVSTSQNQHPNLSQNNVSTATNTTSTINTAAKVETSSTSTRYKAPPQDPLSRQRSKEIGVMPIYRKVADVGHNHKLSPVRQRRVNAARSFHHSNDKEPSRRGVSQTIPRLKCEPS
ncbi:unnamed protein product [Phytomonas sp. Hart1]|nr:unnamed protein product [Phytomonas sp. Hart1]|eukprot:CCW68411.1 unnamed protein product [Phytomonas sp. isolate Hart1]